MFLTSISLSNFRNFKKKTFSFTPGVTAIIGDNTKGKTSICEAIFYLASGKSFRAEKDSEVITWGEEMGRVNAKIKDSSFASSFAEATEGQESYGRTEQSVKSEEQELFEIVFSERKQFLVNGVGKRMVDFVGNLKAVLFRPEDMDLIIGSPSLRRRYLDFILMQVDREYRRSVISYEKGVRQRNRLLERIREEGIPRSQLLFWDQLLIKSGNYISNKRTEYIDYINGKEKNLGNYEVIYDDSQISTARLEQYVEAEIASGNTLVGPHRDDIKLRVKSEKLKVDNWNYRDLSVYGSRGEQRLAVLWLKICELAFIEEKSGERPILLLDDIFSELDHKHRDLVFEIMDKQQTIVTSADPHLIEDGVEMEIIQL